MPLAHRAAELWAEVNSTTSAEVLVPTGFAIVGADDAAQQSHHGVDNIIQRSVDLAQRYGINYEYLTGADLMARYPALQVAADDGVFVEPEAFVIRPELAIQALLDQARSRGADIQESAFVASVAAIAGRATPSIMIDGRSVPGRHIALCTGPWRQRQLLGMNTIDSIVLPQVSLRIKETSRQMMSQPRYPAFVHLAPDGILTYGVPAGGGVDEAKVSIEQSKVAIELPDISLLPRKFVTDQARRILASTQKILPGISFDGAMYDVCYYTTTWNSQLVVERAQQSPAITVVSACSGHGFKYAPAIAELIVEHLDDRDFSLADAVKNDSLT
jgi:glycine/D-amino acid oxidase-like deaminating enzyme